ncbi:MAG: sigma-70 family RNA polymerase sigma factor [Tannerellaceae bacterium]|jgi:RNA polymerase sigma-70 factor (ECF subfamily)|nr:sigma-70 family RNA polymerase sigma factor [Tannerellaceae bacterium]
MLYFPSFVVLLLKMELDRFKITALPLREKLMNISLRMLGEKADAEDVVQEALLKLWHIRDKLNGYNSVEALAVMVAKNLALDKLKARRPVVEAADLWMLDSGEKSPAEWLEQQDAVACIRTLIKQLPSLQQTIIRMKDVEGYELHEIAEITGSRIEAVRTNLSRARKKIREQFIALNQSGT